MRGCCCGGGGGGSAKGQRPTPRKGSPRENNEPPQFVYVYTNSAGGSLSDGRGQDCISADMCTESASGRERARAARSEFRLDSSERRLPLSASPWSAARERQSVSSDLGSCEWRRASERKSRAGSGEPTGGTRGHGRQQTRECISSCQPSALTSGRPGERLSRLSPLASCCRRARLHYLSVGWRVPV